MLPDRLSAQTAACPKTHPEGWRRGRTTRPLRSAEEEEAIAVASFGLIPADFLLLWFRLFFPFSFFCVFSSISAALRLFLVVFFDSFGEVLFLVAVVFLGRFRRFRDFGMLSEDGGRMG